MYQSFCNRLLFARFHVDTSLLIFIKFKLFLADINSNVKNPVYNKNTESKNCIAYFPTFFRPHHSNGVRL